VKVYADKLYSYSRTQFGVEVIVLHEVKSDELQTFLPGGCRFNEVSYYTSCFLALAAPEEARTPTQGRRSVHPSGMFLKGDNHLAYHQTGRSSTVHPHGEAEATILPGFGDSWSAAAIPS
jgi:hypothetical protein